MKKYTFAVLAVWCGLLQTNCGKNPGSATGHGSGELRIWAHVAKQTSALAKVEATTWDSLVMQVSSTADPTDMEIMTQAVKFDTAAPFVNYALTNVPSGKGRLVAVWTKSNKNLIVHTSAGKKLDLASGEIKTLDFTLVPKRGSIYVNIANIPVSANNDTIAGIYASFVFNSQMLSDSVKRNKNVFLTIDNVPDSASGTLFIAGIGKSGDTLYRCSLPLTFYAARDTMLSTQVVKLTTGISMNIAAPLPAATIISASADPKKALGVENGPCIISEIMYAANDSEYIEIYNTLNKDSVFDTLILDIDGVFRYFSNIAIKSKGFFVFGRKSLPWVHATHPVSSALDLSSSGLNAITLRAKDSTAMDLVFFESGANKQEWPNCSSTKKSIVLDSLVIDPLYNNFGKNWRVAQTLINMVDPNYATPATSQCGTPGYEGM